MSYTWKNFASNSTLHGLGYIASTSGIRRLFWLACLLTSFGFTVFVVYDSVQEYISLPINTIISSEIPEDGMEFPDLTICNLNTFVRSKTKVGYGDPRLKMLNLDLKACNVVRNISGNLTCGQALVCAYKLHAIYVIPNCDVTIQTKLRHALSTSSRVFNPEELLIAYGNDLKKMLLPHCRFGPEMYTGDKPCIAEDFDQVLTPHGVCYTFNVTKFCNRTGLTTNRLLIPGAENGLGLILHAQLNEMEMGDWSSGFRIMVNQKGRFINTDEGFIVSPGTHTLVFLQATKV